MKVAVVGTGYVGLVTATCLAESGNEVVGVDKDARKIDTLDADKLPIYEPGLLELVQRNRREGRLTFTTDLAAAVKPARLIFIAVGTPQSPAGDADLSAIWAVGDEIARQFKAVPPGPPGSRVVIVKSTVPVGTNTRLYQRLQAAGCPHLDVASNPEFLKEGAAIDDFMKPDRVVVGVRRPEVADVLRELYAPFLRTENPFLVMSPESAEMTKYAANAMLATKISFMNEMANIAERVGADIEEVRQGIGSDPRIGYQFIYPGCGYGGSCFPKDVRALAHTAEASGFKAELLEAVERVNNAQKGALFRKLVQAFDGDLLGRTIALWGLAFKPNTDDMRDAPSRTLMEALWEAGAAVRAFDPEAMKEARRHYGERPDFILTSGPQDAAAGADALVICTEWKQFRVADFAWLKANLKSPVIVDGRNLYEPDEVRRHGLLYYAVGRGDSVRGNGMAAEPALRREVA